MKIALLLPGYLDSPDYYHMKYFEKRLSALGYKVERLDPCNLWSTGIVANYSITNYIKQVGERIKYLIKNNKPDEILLLGHSLGGFVSIIAGSIYKEVTSIVSLCSAPDRIGAYKDWKNKKYRHSKREIPNKVGKFREFEIPIQFAKDGLKYSSEKAVKNVSVPLMLFIALDDKTCPPELTERIVKKARNPYVVRQPNMGHDFRKNPKQTKIVMDQIEKFLVHEK